MYYFTFKIIMIKLCMKIFINSENKYLLDKFGWISSVYLVFFLIWLNFIIVFSSLGY